MNASDAPVSTGSLQLRHAPENTIGLVVSIVWILLLFLFITLANSLGVYPVA